jgi:cytochrome c553
MKYTLSHKSVLLGSALLFGVFAICSEKSAAGGDAAAGAKSAMYCAYCHGPAGNSTYTGTPRLAGQSAESFIAKMKLYKSNKKIYHPMMAFLAGGLSDQDIQDLAAFYAKQPVRQSLQPYNAPQPYP